MTSETFTLKAVTPIFSYGATDRPEIRPTAIKGQLRYWFRAMMGGVIGTSDKALENLRDIESRIFGSTEQRSKIDLRVEPFSVDSNWIEKKFPKEWEGSGLHYCFFSMKGMGGKPDKQHIKQGYSFELKLFFHQDKQIEDIKNCVIGSLWLWTNLGGFGSRSRRGGGSLKATYKNQPENHYLDFNYIPDNAENLKRHLENGIASVKESFEELAKKLRYTPITSFSKTPSFSCFAPSYSEILVLDNPFDEPLKALDHFGDSMKNFRSVKSSTVNGNCRSDYGRVKKYMISGDINNDEIHRASFGLPINFFSRSRKNRNITPYSVFLEPNHKEYKRRGSPFHIHVTPLNNKKYALVITYFKAEFLPNKINIKIIAKKRARKFVDLPSSYTTVDTFLNTLSSKKVSI